MKIIDLTMLLEEDLPSDPEIQIPAPAPADCRGGTAAGGNAVPEQL